MAWPAWVVPSRALAWPAWVCLGLTRTELAKYFVVFNVQTMASIGLAEGIDALPSRMPLRDPADTPGIEPWSVRQAPARPSVCTFANVSG